ncbi:MAG: hypothetical protein ACK5ME_13615 [Parahaliea sp.]
MAKTNILFSHAKGFQVAAEALGNTPSHAQYIEVNYNQTRHHSTNGYISSKGFETLNVV